MSSLEEVCKRAECHELAEMEPGHIKFYADGANHEFEPGEGIAGYQAVKLSFEFGPTILITGHGDDCDNWIDIQEIPR